VAVALFVLVCLGLARAHRVVGLGVETDFYAFYVPDAALIRRGLLPTHSFSGPGYPALLALLGSLLGDDFTAAKAISLAAAPLAAIGFYGAFRQVVSPRVALWTLLFLLSGSVFVESAISASTDMFALALLAGALYFSFRPTGLRWRNYLLAGGMTGLAYLARSNAVVLVPAFLAALVVVNPLRESIRARLKAAGLYVAALALVTTPWFWFCHRQTGMWLDNKNYINVAMEMNGLDSSGDDYVQVVGRYQSIGTSSARTPCASSPASPGTPSGASSRICSGSSRSPSISSCPPACCWHCCGCAAGAWRSPSTPRCSTSLSPSSPDVPATTSSCCPTT